MVFSYRFASGENLLSAQFRVFQQNTAIAVIQYPDLPAKVGRMNLSWVPDCAYMDLCSFQAPSSQQIAGISNGIIG